MGTTLEYKERIERALDPNLKRHFISMSYTISETFWYPSSRRHGCYTEPHVQARPYFNTCHLSNNLLTFSNKHHVLYNSGYSNESLGDEK